MSGENEARAREMGWVPKEEFKLNPDRWVDAEAYLRRGEEVLPILRANNRKLSDDVVALRTESQALKTQLAESQAAIEDLKNFNNEIAKSNAAAKKRDLLAAIAEAKRSGETDVEVQLTDQLSELNSEIKASKAAPEVKEPTVKASDVPVVTAEMTAWLEQNPWFGKDKRKTGYSFGVAEELKAQGIKPNSAEWFEKLDAEVDKQFGQNQRRQNASKVEGSNGGGSGSGSSDSKTYADLPEDAKAACEKLAPKFIGKAFKTQADWRAHYVTKYFET
jgi:hypothetical protein